MARPVRFRDKWRIRCSSARHTYGIPFAPRFAAAADGAILRGTVEAGRAAAINDLGYEASLP